MTRLLKLWRLTPTERRFLLGAALLVGGVRVGLSLLHARDPMPAERIAWAVAAAGRGIPRATCLVQALAAQVLLARHGHVAQLRIGVARATEGIAAHAWLERDGEPIFGAPDRFPHAVLPPHESRTA